VETVSAIAERSASASPAPLIPCHWVRATRSKVARSTLIASRSSAQRTPSPTIHPPSAIAAPAVAARQRESWFDGRQTVSAR